MPPPHDWASGPAKWVAVLVLGSASVFGIAWSAFTRVPGWAPPQDRHGARQGRAHEADAGVASEAPKPETHETSAPEREPETESPASPSSSIAHRVNINSATASELELLPGIGPALASRILDYRKSNGRFKTVEDLDNVKGIGPRTLEKLRPLIRVE